MLKRDPRQDGKFFVGVHTTGIYCRPICPARKPLFKNVSFYETPEAAVAAGFRACLRCRPESKPGSPAWKGTSAPVSRALRLIQSPSAKLDEVSELASRVGLGERHLRRLFQQFLQTTPTRVVGRQRLGIACQLLRETKLSVSHIAFASGFKSIRRFNDAFKKCYQTTPRELRRRRA